MQRVSEKILIGFILLALLLVTSFGVIVQVKASNGSFEIDVSVRGTYLYVDPRDNSGVESPSIVDLQSNSISAGDTILISFEGTVDNYGRSDYHTLDYLIGVFSSTNQLLPVSEAERVPDAINAGDDYDTSETWFSHENTDIPEDFQITPSTGFLIQVPQNAMYLFISMLDSWYPDNTSPSSITVTIEKQSNELAAGIPLEYLLLAFGIVAVFAVLVFLFMLKRKKLKKQG
jgi:hypothetical protein